MSEKKLNPVNEIAEEVLDGVAGGATEKIRKGAMTKGSVVLKAAECPHCHAALPYSLSYLPVGTGVSGTCPSCKRQYTLGSCSL